MRILIAHSFYRLAGGEDTYVRGQIRLLEGKHDIELVAGSNEDLSENLGTATGMLWSRDRKREMTRTIARFQPDLIHVHNIYPSLGPAVHLAATEAGVPLIMTVHNYRLRCPNGYRFTEGSPCTRCEGGVYVNAMLHACFPSFKQSAAYASVLWSHRFLLKLQKKVSIFVAPSTFVRDWLVDGGIASKRVAVIPNFAEPSPGATARVGEYGIYVGRLSSEKGLDVLLRALRLAGDPPFWIVGDGPGQTELIALKEELGLRNTSFTGRLVREEVDAALSRCRYLVMPSIWDENCPMVVLEAMAHGRPLLVTDRGGLPELTSMGNGLMCRPSEPGDMAVGIRRLVDDDDLCEKAGARGLDLFARGFTPENHLKRLERVYRSCLQGHRAGFQ